MTQQAIIITIGNELLNGTKLDTNSFWLSEQLNSIGIEVIKKISIQDDFDSIWCTLKENEKCDLIIVTGGLGPTADDVTKPLLAKYFGGKMVCHKASLAIIKKLLHAKNRPLLDRNIKQSYVPSSCSVFLNKQGTAPGMCFVKNKRILISLPGVPFEMKEIFVTQVQPFLKKNFNKLHIIHSTLLLFGIGESLIAEKIVDIENAMPSHIQLAYLPSSKFVCLRLNGMGANKKQVKIQVQAIKEKIKNRLAEFVISEDANNMLAAFIEYVSKHNITIACAESCTGGYIAHLLTQQAGASNFFMGSIVSYSNNFKEKILKVPSSTLQKYSAVSKETAKKMHKNLLSQISADYGLSIVGYLSGSEDNIPVGQIFICVGNKNKQIVNEIKLNQKIREENLKISANIALLHLLQFIKINHTRT